jgi:hypothetical protein
VQLIVVAGDADRPYVSSVMHKKKTVPQAVEKNLSLSLACVLELSLPLGS